MKAQAVLYLSMVEKESKSGSSISNLVQKSVHRLQAITLAWAAPFIVDPLILSIAISKRSIITVCLEETGNRFHKEE